MVRSCRVCQTGRLPVISASYKWTKERRQYMAISFIDVISFIKELLADPDKLAKFKEIIADVKELISDIKDLKG